MGNRECMCINIDINMPEATSLELLINQIRILEQLSS